MSTKYTNKIMRYQIYFLRSVAKNNTLQQTTLILINKIYSNTLDK